MNFPLIGAVVVMVDAWLVLLFLAACPSGRKEAVVFMVDTSGFCV